MSKNMNDKAKKVKKVELDPSLYTYRQEDMVEISGRTLIQLISLLDMVANREIEPVVEYSSINEGEDFAAWMKRIDSTEKLFVPKRAHLARTLGMYLASVHNDNVQQGKAVHFSELKNETVTSTKEENTTEDIPVVKK